jgi:hypothetical protein
MLLFQIYFQLSKVFLVMNGILCFHCLYHVFFISKERKTKNGIRSSIHGGLKDMIIKISGDIHLKGEEVSYRELSRTARYTFPMTTLVGRRNISREKSTKEGCKQHRLSQKSSPLNAPPFPSLSIPRESMEDNSQKWAPLLLI